MPDLTPNINLKKPLLTEAANIEVINENMDKIDSEIAKVRDSAKREHLSDLFTNGIISNALKELKITQTDTPSKAIKIDTGKVNIDGIVYTFSESSTLNIESSDALDVTNEPHTSNASGKFKLTYFPVANQAGDGLATKTDITVTKVRDGSVVNVININAQTGEVTTEASNESVQVNYKSFCKRIDVVYVDADGTLKVLKGTPVLSMFTPKIPDLKEGMFKLGEINLSANFKVVTNDMVKSYEVFYSINGLEDDLNEVDAKIADLTMEIPKKVNKPSSANNGHIVVFDVNANAIKDGGISINTVLKSSSDVYVQGIYSGNGAATRTIFLGFTPKAVIVYKEGLRQYMRYDTYNGGRVSNAYGGMAVTGGSCSNVITIVTNGFSVAYDYSTNKLTNESNGKYYYIAFK